MPTSRIDDVGLAAREDAASAATKEASKYDSVIGPSARSMRSNTLDELCVRRVVAVEADPLVEPPQVRRRERADVVACVPIDALEHRDARALAVRARHGNDLVRRRAQAELVEHGDEPVERQVDPLRVQRLEPREPMIERQTAPRRKSSRGRASGLRTARAGRRASRAAPRSGRAPGADRGSCRSRLSRAGIRRAGSLRATSRRSSARSRAAPRNRSARPGSAMLMSPSSARLADTPPVVGSVITET